MDKNYIQLTIPFDFEEFRDIEGYEGLYRISNQGKVYSVKRDKFLKPQKKKNGYLHVNLSKNEKQKFYYVHRLVASAFIPNPQNYKEVNHISEDKTDNRVENLEWMSHKENCNYGTRNERQLAHPNCGIKQLKVVQQFTRQGEFVAEFPSTWEASRQTKINQGSISKCCRGNKKYSHAGGFVWRYKI
jgi:hypothetical protein